MHKPHLELARLYWQKILQPADSVIDATCGNGHDTRFLAGLVPEGRVISIDIQLVALEKARALGAPAHVEFLHQSHATLPTVPNLKLIVYNLGYLPGGNKGITTVASTTLESLNVASERVERGGALSVMCYPGHPEGAIEAKKVEAWSSQLNFLEWEVSHHQWRLGSPTLTFIVKK